VILRGDRRYLNLSPRSIEDGPADPPSFRVGECPCCGVWRELRSGRVVGHRLNNGDLCRGSGLKAMEVDET